MTETADERIARIEMCLLALMRFHRSQVADVHQARHEVQQLGKAIDAIESEFQTADLPGEPKVDPLPVEQLLREWPCWRRGGEDDHRGAGLDRLLQELLLWH